jgi:hypothetical protein
MRSLEGLATMTMESQGPTGDPRNVIGAFYASRFNTVPAQQIVTNIGPFPAAFSNLRPDTRNNLDATPSKDIPGFARVNPNLSFPLHVVGIRQCEQPGLVCGDSVEPILRCHSGIGEYK